VAPDIVIFVSAKTVCFANILRSWRGTRIGAYCLVPRVYMTLTCHGGSCKHCRGNQCRRSEFQLGHQLLHLIRKANCVWLLYGNGDVIISMKEHFITSLQRRARSACDSERVPKATFLSWERPQSKRILRALPKFALAESKTGRCYRKMLFSRNTKFLKIAEVLRAQRPECPH
jgi:hypothetical protein